MTQRQRQDARHREVVRAYYQTGNEGPLGSMLADLRTQGMAYLRSRLRVQDTERAEDVVQDALTRLLHLLRTRKFEPEGRPPGVLFCVICKGKYLNSLAAKPSRPGRQEDPFLLVSTSCATAAEELASKTENAALAARTVASATQAVLALDPAARAAVLLHFYHGLPAEQAAQQLGLPTESYQARLHRGLLALRAWGQHQPRPSAEVYAALRHVNTGDLFREPLRLAG